MPHQQFTPTVDLKTYCYTLDDVKKIAGLVTDYQKCQVALTDKTALINEKLMTFDGATAGAQWWQEPAFIIGGVVVSASVASLLTLYFMRPK